MKMMIGLVVSAAAVLQPDVAKTPAEAIATANAHIGHKTKGTF